MQRQIFRIASILLLSLSYPVFGQEPASDTSLCGNDSQPSTFHRLHYAGGDVTVAVPLDADGNPRDSFEPGSFVADVVASGKREASIFSAHDKSDIYSIPPAASIRVACYADGKRVTVKTSLSEAAPDPIMAKEFAQNLAESPEACRDSLAKDNERAKSDKSVSKVPVTTVALSTAPINGYSQTVAARCYTMQDAAQTIKSGVLYEQLVCDKGDHCFD